MRNIDETIITDAGLPKSWTCPHCGKRNKMGNFWSFSKPCNIVTCAVMCICGDWF